MSQIDSDTLVECARTVLQAQYRQRVSELQARLSGFETVNWDGVKARLREKPALVVVSTENEPSDVCALRLQAVMAWLEEILTP